MSNAQGMVQYTYNGLGDRLSQTANGAKTVYHLDLNAGLTQVLDDGLRTYLYGNGRIGYTADDAYYYLGDALGAVREVVQGDTEPQVILMRDYEPYGEVLAQQGGDASGYGYTGEMFDTQTGLVFLRARYYSPADGRFLSKDSWRGDYILPLSYNLWLYGYSNPILNTDPTGNWTCIGHSDCTKWVSNALSQLKASGNTGKQLVKFFKEYDTKIKMEEEAAIEVVLDISGIEFDPCNKLHQGKGLLIEFTDTPSPQSLANTFNRNKMQLLKSTYISGPNPTNWGVITFGHEISHYKQGLERFTIQGEMFAQYAGAQIWKDLGEVEADMPHGLNLELVSTKTGHPELYNPFIKFPGFDYGLERARAKMAESSWTYALLPLYLIGLNEGWMTTLSIDWYKTISYK